MNFKIVPSKICGFLTAPSSKSFALRAVVAASLCEGKSVIKNISLCEDLKSIIFAFRKFGVKFEFLKNSLIVHGGINKKLVKQKIVVDCFSCGFTFRIFSFLSCIFPFDIFLIGSSSLFKRPLVCNIKLNGKIFKYMEKYEDFYKVKGRLVPGKYEVDCFISSQFLTGLLFSLPNLNGDSEIIFKNKLESKQYFKMTISVLKSFGIVVKKTRNGLKIPGNQKFLATNFFVEGDYSLSAFFQIVGVFWPICIEGLNKNSLQEDKKILGIIKKCGASVFWKEKYLFIIPKKKPKSFSFNIENTIDLAPCLVVLACFCSGVSKIFGIERLKFKESNRIESILSLVNSLSGRAFVLNDCIIVEGGKKLKGGFVSGFEDHRIVMAAFIISCFCKGEIVVSNVESVFKSNVSFLRDFKALGGVFSGVFLE